MARTDLTEQEISRLERKAKRELAGGAEAWQISKLEADQILRLTGEVIELRNREAHTRQLHNLEWDEY